MLSKYRQKRQEGFTIIEVLIVLAIAGLILLVVFLAVPALQRNNRNTQRDNDVAGILGGMSEFVNNNNGQLPSGFGGDANDGTLIIGNSSNNENTVEVNLGFYVAGQVDLVSHDSQTSDIDDSNVEIVTGATCDGNSVASTSGPTRAYVAWYEKEVNAKQCRGS